MDSYLKFKYSNLYEEPQVLVRAKYDKGSTDGDLDKASAITFCLPGICTTFR